MTTTHTPTATESPAQTVRRFENKVTRVHRELANVQRPLDWRWNLFLCDCGRLMSSSRPRHRCEHCLSYPDNPVEVALTPYSALAYVLMRNHT